MEDIPYALLILFVGRDQSGYICNIGGNGLFSAGVSNCESVNAYANASLI